MADKGKILSIVSWSLVVLLLIWVGVLGLSAKKQATRADGFRDSLVELGDAAGVEALSQLEVEVVEEAAAEAPAEEAVEGDAAEGEETVEEEAVQTASLDDALISTIVEQVKASILSTELELASTKSALKKARDDASDAQTVADTFAQEQTEAAAALSKELAAAGEELDAAKADAKKSGEALKKAEKSAKKKQAKLKKKITGLKTQMEEETARLQAELDVALQPPVEAELEDAESMPKGAELATLLSEEELDVEQIEEEVIEEIEIIEEPGRVIGQSEMFTLIQYSAENGTMLFQLQDGQTLSYQDIPMDVADNLLMAEENLDMKYRFKIQGNFKSIPPDSVVIRKFWKNIRHHPELQELRLIEDEVVPEVEIEAEVVEVETEEVVVEAEVETEAEVVEVEAEAVEVEAPEAEVEVEAVEVEAEGVAVEE